MATTLKLADIDNAEIARRLNAAVERAAAEARDAAATSAGGGGAPALRGTKAFNPTVPSFKESTAKLYIRQGKALAERCGYCNGTSITTMLSKTEDAIAHLKATRAAHSWSLQTLLSHVARVLGIVKQAQLQELVGEDRVDLWREFQRELAAEGSTPAAKERRTEKMVENWVSIKEILKKFEQLEADPITRHKPETILLGMCALMRPLRGGDAGTLCIRHGTPVDKLMKHETTGDAVNCIVFHSANVMEDATGAHILLHDYKVARCHGPLTIPIPKRLVDLMQESLRKQPRSHLFIDRTGKPRTREGHSEWAKDTLTRHLGKNVTGTLLRHVSASEIDWNEADWDDLAKHADDMGTSVGMLTKHYKVSKARLRQRDEPKPAGGAGSRVHSPAAKRRHTSGAEEEASDGDAWGGAGAGEATS